MFKLETIFPQLLIFLKQNTDFSLDITQVQSTHIQLSWVNQCVKIYMNAWKLGRQLTCEREMYILKEKLLSKKYMIFKLYCFMPVCAPFKTSFFFNYSPQVGYL